MSYDSFSILSVDWDYFFPNLHYFDWGFNEKLSLFFSGIWEIRAYQDMYMASNGYYKEGKGKRIIDYVQPRFDEVRSFWDQAIAAPPLSIAIAETHESLYELAQYWPLGSIWNFDAHHDFGYHSDAGKDCGNWAKRLYDEGYFESPKTSLFEREYHVVYPEWRKKDPEPNFGEVKGVLNVHYGMPKRLPYFRHIFICRSSVWTPSWCDDLWMEFIEDWKEHSVWTTKSHAPYAIKPRVFEEKSAESCRKQMEEIISKTNYLGENHA